MESGQAETVFNGQKNPGRQEKTLSVERLKEKYSGNGEKVYTVNTSVMIDDDTDEEFSFVFVKPKTASYDRYVKMMSNSATKAARAFSMDNIVPEQRDFLADTLNEYPAMSISLADKLLKMLGLADTTSVKKL
ncbi:MAG: hypothetical protein HFG77_07410 [Hungatella sp.]|nr:hypothetical protein [Dorea sp.]MCI9636209.1 hypothetical protein [Hungatella sp.]